jgi:ABC-type uncharacterized transport system auxiliary subunit
LLSIKSFITSFTAVLAGCHNNNNNNNNNNNKLITNVSDILYNKKTNQLCLIDLAIPLRNNVQEVFVEKIVNI